MYQLRCFVRYMFLTFRKALEAADNILITLRYPANPKALTVKGEALYNMGDFEHALVCFHRAMKNANTRVIQKFKGNDIISNRRN